jgi:hypothetical protein
MKPLSVALVKYQALLLPLLRSSASPGLAWLGCWVGTVMDEYLLVPGLCALSTALISAQRQAA